MRVLCTYVFVLCFVLLVLLASLVTLLCGWLLPLKKRVVITHYTEKALSLLLRLCGGIKVDINFANQQAIEEFMLAGRSLLVVANHQSRWETFYLQSLFSPLINVLKHELLHIPIAGWALACYWPVAVRRSQAIATVRRVEKEGIMRLAAGFNLLIFPQATRLPTGEIGHISSSAARLAVTAKAVVVPVVHNSGRYWPKKSFRLTPGTIRVDIGAPLDCREKSAKEVAAYYQDFFMQKIASQQATTASKRNMRRE